MGAYIYILFQTKRLSLESAMNVEKYWVGEKKTGQNNAIEKDLEERNYYENNL